jgi:hypothetical protein
VVSFIRPNGLDRPATPIMADAVESLARLATARPRTASSVATIAIRAMLLVIGAYGGVCRWWTGVDRAARVKQQVRHARAVRRTWSTWLGRRL